MFIRQNWFSTARCQQWRKLFQHGLLAQIRQRGLYLLQCCLQSRPAMWIGGSRRQDLLPLQLQLLTSTLFPSVDPRSCIHRSRPLRLLFFDRLRFPTL